MYHVICCNGYYRVGESNDINVVTKMCMEHVDGDFASVIVDEKNRIVGDCVDGFTGRSLDGGPPYDHATATGMYDRY